MENEVDFFGLGVAAVPSLFAWQQPLWEVELAAAVFAALVFASGLCLKRWWRSQVMVTPTLQAKKARVDFAARRCAAGRWRDRA